MLNIKLETKRLKLREMTLEDISFLKRILKDKDVMYAYEGPFNDSEVMEWFLKQKTRYEKYGFGLWAVALKQNNEMIGQCGITMQDFNGRQVPEIGYLFNKDYWHNSYATESAIACRDYAFSKLGINEIFSIIRDSNIPSQYVALRVGMKPVGNIVKVYRGVTMPHIVYSIKNLK